MTRNTIPSQSSVPMTVLLRSHAMDRSGSTTLRDSASGAAGLVVRKMGKQPVCHADKPLGGLRLVGRGSRLAGLEGCVVPASNVRQQLPKTNLKQAISAAPSATR